MVKTLYVDMDGTLAEFKPVPLEELYKEGYFKNLAPQVNVIEAVRMLIAEDNGVQVRLLSCYLKDNDFALKEKQEWVRNYISELSKDAIFLPCGASKADYIAEESYLLDDFTDNLLLWVESGKKGIKLYNNINGTKGRWEGFWVRAEDPAEAIAGSIKEFMSR